MKVNALEYVMNLVAKKATVVVVGKTVKEKKKKKVK
jgi:hypothetical protein